jgi:glycosyltransferase involved in cell wall biosynthesis
LVANSAWNLAHYRRPWIEALLADGYVVMTAAPEDDYVARLESLTGTPHARLQHLNPRGRNGFSDLALMRELSRVYRKRTPDVVVHFTIKPNIFGGVVARRMGIPYLAVITGLGYTFIHGGWRNKKLVPWLYRKGLRSAAEVIFYNETDRDLFRIRRIIGPDAGYLIPGSGVNLKHFALTPLPELKASGLHFLYLGRILRDKGILELLAAAKVLREEGHRFRLSLVGDLQAKNPEVIEVEELRTHIEAVNQIDSTGDETNPCVQYLEAVDDVRPFLADCHVFVLPSYREGLSIAGVEALAVGRPIIVTDVPGCRELLTPTSAPNGFGCASRSTTDLARAMRSMLELPSTTLSKMAERSHRHASDHFSGSVTGKSFTRLVAQQLNQGKYE